MCSGNPSIYLTAIKVIGVLIFIFSIGFNIYQLASGIKEEASSPASMVSDPEALSEIHELEFFIDRIDFQKVLMLASQFNLTKTVVKRSVDENNIGAGFESKKNEVQSDEDTSNFNENEFKSELPYYLEEEELLSRMKRGGRFGIGLASLALSANRVGGPTRFFNRFSQSLKSRQIFYNALRQTGHTLRFGKHPLLRGGRFFIRHGLKATTLASDIVTLRYASMPQEKIEVMTEKDEKKLIDNMLEEAVINAEKESGEELSFEAILLLEKAIVADFDEKKKARKTKRSVKSENDLSTKELKTLLMAIEQGEQGLAVEEEESPASSFQKAISILDILGGIFGRFGF